MADATKVTNRVDDIGDAAKGTDRINDFDDASNINKLPKWKEKLPNYEKHKKIYDNPKYFDQETGRIRWPGEYGDPNTDGFLNGKYKESTIKKGAEIDRYGKDTGKYLTPADTPFEQRALPPGSETTEYHKYEVLRDIPAKEGEIAPWFNQPGGGTQYLTEESVKELIKKGYLREIK